jgi:AMP-binding enzyme/Phosphopantetheine attachment site
VSPLVDHLRRQGNRVAVLTETEQLTYRELADRVADSALEMGAQRRLVLLETRNDVTTLTHYLGALAGNQVVLPVPAGRDHATLVQTYRPGIVVDGGGIHHRHHGEHHLHDDLALLLSTSGSTGSPKLVRLSHTNLVANAVAIAEYLDIRETDRAATTLPMSYCYGLSVVHSHLLCGAGLILTDHSVTDNEFWELFRRHHGTAFAGVPYTFELLERVGFDAMALPDLRYLTQAGGRMPPERVRRFAELGRRQGWDLWVMYGATEATARMAYLPPELVASHPSTIGRPIPGGSFTIEPVEGWTDDAVGELVFRGPNVMMGYAHGSADLALPKTVDTLHTGDIGRRGPDGLYEVVGRSSRFAKMYGLRIDLQRLESTMRDHGIGAFCTDDADRLVVAATGRHDAADVQRVAADAAGVPAGAVRAVTVTDLPMLSSGKPDYQAVRALARDADATEAGAIDLRVVVADVLHLDPAAVDPRASFTDLGGNSLSYVTMSIQLERALGTLPVDWHRLPLRRLEELSKPRPRRRPWWGATLETSVALRATAIVLIVGSHAELFKLWGGAHILLGVAGYNFARFCLTPVSRVERVRRLRNTIAWIAVPSVLWAAIALMITDDYRLSNLLLANKFLGPHDSMTAGRLWFVEVLVWTLVALAALFLIPAVDRLERRRPFAFAAVLLAVAMALRYDVLQLHLGRAAWFTMLAFWFFAAGWAAAKASTIWQRILVTVVLAVGLYGYFDSILREVLVLAGVVLLIWVPAVRCPAAMTVVAGIVAEASLYTYLTHYQVIELFNGLHPLLGVVASVVVGIGITYLATLLRKGIRERRHRVVSSTAVPALP